MIYERCSNCEYWKHGECMITKKKKHDQLCDCRQFRPRKS